MSGGMIRAKDIQPDDVLDRIFKAWVRHKVDEELSLQDRWILERMEYIDARLSHGGARSIYSTLVEDVYQAFGKAHDITKRTIENDIARTKRFFLSVRPRDDKDYAKGMYIKWGERMLAKFEDEGDNLSWNMLYKQLGKLQEFDKADLILPEYQKVQPPPIMVVTEASEIGVPAIDNLEEELRLLRAPKNDKRNTDNIEEAEVEDDSAE